MKSNRFWLLLFAALLVLSVLLAVYVTHRARPHPVAMLYQDGRLLEAIALDGDFQPYTLTVTGPVENVIAVEPGRIRVQSATCPDQLCVHQGWLSGGMMPIVCLPNGLVIELSGGGQGPDAVAQ